MAAAIQIITAGHLLDTVALGVHCQSKTQKMAELYSPSSPFSGKKMSCLNLYVFVYAEYMASFLHADVAVMLIILQGLTVLWLFLIGGMEVLKMALGYLFGKQKRAVQGGFDNGDLEYHVIVAKKPAVAAKDVAQAPYGEPENGGLTVAKGQVPAGAVLDVTD